ncbi:MAG: Rieske (2Fe-2S) protein [Anaerolineae bacterium]|nr:Rieske (2Fe-2S) protein [Anaerolineae bacterium]
MGWVKVLAVAELPEGQRAVVHVEDKEILLLHHDGQIYAVQSKCPHMGAPLKRAKIEAGALVCPVHRSAFDLQTGDAKEWIPWPPVVGKLMGAVSSEKALPTYPTRIEEGSVWVEI